LHLDSPLLGLACKSPDFARRVETASREAFDNLIVLAIEEGCRFVVFAGDVFDGDVRNFQVALYFMDGMRRLADASIDVFLVLGNHDSANRFAGKLEFADNVHVFGKARAGAKRLEDVGVVVHGRSFPRADFNENMARDYPAAVPGWFNIGLLHTACAGSEGEHARYAPCTVEQLVNHGYDYWALGHVHGHAILSEAPHIVYSGNLQGRDPRETGAKGAVLVTVEDGMVASVEHRGLDVVRWAVLTAEVGRHVDRSEMRDALREIVRVGCADAGHRPVALRLIVTGETALHSELLLQSASVREDIETLLETLPQEVWLEKFVIGTAPLPAAEAVDPTVAGRLDAELLQLAKDGRMAEALEEQLTEIRGKLPGGVQADKFIERMRAEIPGRAASHARALVSEAGHAAD
jgi:DNA repair exonuclease SbcCD nuclease subunit